VKKMLKANCWKPWSKIFQKAAWK